MRDHEKFAQVGQVLLNIVEAHAKIAACRGSGWALATSLKFSSASRRLAESPAGLERTKCLEHFVAQAPAGVRRREAPNKMVAITTT
jgi:hypothetical protein